MSTESEVLCEVKLYSMKSQSILGAILMFFVAILLWLSYILYSYFGKDFIYDYYAVFSVLSLILLTMHLKILPTQFPYFAYTYVTQNGLEFYHWLIPTQKVSFDIIQEVIIAETSSDRLLEEGTKTIFFVLKNGQKASKLLRPKIKDTEVYIENDFDDIDRLRDEVQKGEIVIVPNVINYQTVENVLKRAKKL